MLEEVYKNDDSKYIKSFLSGCGEIISASPNDSDNELVQKLKDGDGRSQSLWPYYTLATDDYNLIIRVLKWQHGL